MMTESEFTEIVSSTREIVLSAIEKNLAERFSYAIDDVAQETYFRAYKALKKDQFRQESKLSTWLYTIARNESLRMNDKLRKEEERAEKLTKSKKEEDFLISHTDLNENSKRLNSQEMIGTLRALLVKIPDKYRKVLEFYLAGYSESQIAETMGVKPGTVKSRAFRGKEMIKRVGIKEKFYEK
ncbi:RNA polymerase sigma factor [Leptospira borgpetersenii]|uniref:Sigma E factor negative regulatory protein RpoE family protein n=4 Tax=Leptospira borgpetersenii TaxID=174 RepID=M3GFD6_LEPBO|nr:RNA polymerase sigma factor [Leptospira borgpetersenii]EMF99666.1 sigma E factor negative regulatory protein RpoE family protein [Leptospira borgpetersenii str. 200701203]EMO09000.1 sigma E factor negative regulatory protein RpoE family protein [Leptospira borgpetersenii str. Noumea 25]ALO27409.1 sigma E factor negative regulatory protein RpoE family protein [Leptospira borgpetersenii serovar Ballum]ANH01751.1 Sigma E factor negative regulatory protein RpoE family protein [Leptospira borgpet